jgi:hypothetical protein
MKYIRHHIDGQSIAELSAKGFVISTVQQFLQMIMDSSAEGIIVHKENIDEKFFGLAKWPCRRDAAKSGQLQIAALDRWRLFYL